MYFRSFSWFLHCPENHLQMWREIHNRQSVQIRSMLANPQMQQQKLPLYDNGTQNSAFQKGELGGIIMKNLIRKAKGKKKAQLKHAKRRFEGRFEISLNDNEYLQLINKIQKGRAEFVERQSNRVTIWDIEHNDKTIRVVYDKRTKVIVSALPIYGLENKPQIEEVYVW